MPEGIEGGIQPGEDLPQPSQGINDWAAYSAIFNSLNSTIIDYGSAYYGGQDDHSFRSRRNNSSERIATKVDIIELDVEERRSPMDSFFRKKNVKDQLESNMVKEMRKNITLEEKDKATCKSVSSILLESIKNKKGISLDLGLREPGTLLVTDFRVSPIGMRRIVGVILAITINGKIIETFQDLEFILNKDFSGSLSKLRSFIANGKGNIKYVVSVIPTKEGDKPLIQLIDVFLRDSSLTEENNKSGYITYINSLPVKIIDSHISSKSFGYKTLKQKNVGEVFTDYSIKFGESSVLERNTYYAEINIEGKYYKFALCDLELQILGYKGYNFPKDKTIFAGNKIKLIRNKDCKNVSVGTEMFVEKIVENRKSGKVNKRSFNGKLDTIVCVDSVGKKHTFYAKDLKLVN